jgi:hypothetical protein
MTSSMRLPSRGRSSTKRALSPASAVLALLLSLAGLALGCSMFDTGMSEAKDLQRVGLPAQAEILAIGETGLTVNDNPVITLDVEVRPADRPPYQATIKRLLVSRLEVPQFQPGRVIPVRFDPKDPSRVSFDLGPPKAAKTGNPFVDNFVPQQGFVAGSLAPAPPTPALYRGGAADKADTRALIEAAALPSPPAWRRRRRRRARGRHRRRAGHDRQPAAAGQDRPRGELLGQEPAAAAGHHEPAAERSGEGAPDAQRRHGGRSRDQ